jgi:hypothetical protein
VLEKKDSSKEIDLDNFIESLGEKRDTDEDVKVSFKDCLAIVIAMFQVLLPIILVLLGILIFVIIIKFK